MGIDHILYTKDTNAYALFNALNDLISKKVREENFQHTGHVVDCEYTHMIDAGDAAVVRKCWEKELKRLQKL